MKIRIAALLAALLLAAAPLRAADSTARVTEATVKKSVEAKINQQVTSVTKTAFGGLYEVFVDGQIFYTDEGVSFFVLGNLVDARSMQNVTEARLRTLNAIKFDSLPLDKAIKFVKGTGKRKMAVFSDPDCPFCRRLEKDLANLNDVTIYTFLYPIESLHPAAVQKSKAIWCSPDRAKAWNDYMLKGVAPTAPATCSNPVDEIVELGRKNRINGTPTIIFADDRTVPGAVPVAQIEKYLEAAAGGK